MDLEAFLRADSSNLPKVDSFMIIEFMKTSDKHNVAEIRGVKALLSSRDSYLESAVGYVELKRLNNECFVRAKVVPEHKIRTPPYKVSVKLDENLETIIETSCDGCAASTGGCKHTLVLMFWLEKRSSEPSPTSTQCYWKKPALANAANTVITSEEIFPSKKRINLDPKNEEVLSSFFKESLLHNCDNAIISCYNKIQSNKPLTFYCIFDLMLDYNTKNSNGNYNEFIEFCKSNITLNVVREIELKTQNQVDNSLWHSIRQGRITASKLYEVAHCKTDGYLVEEILGGYKAVETAAMKRGRNLEKVVMKEIEKVYHCKVQKSGFYILNGIFGASPDGKCNDFIVEVKCPSSEKTKKNFLKSDNTLSNKCMAQVQLQMHASNTDKCMFCVADPKFEENKIINTVMVDLDTSIVSDLMTKAECFWKIYVYPKILKSVK